MGALTYLSVISPDGLTADAAKWITVKSPSKSGEGKGKKALIDSETGQILGGLGGKFNGVSIREVSKVSKQRKAAAKAANTAATTQQATAPTAGTKTPAAPKIDLTLPDKIDHSIVLQNRSRANEASKQQMASIARGLDYYRVGTSNDFNSGAPVISYGTYDPENFGRKTVLVSPDGKRMAVQYAVVEANDVTPSHNVNGEENKAYYSDDPSLKRAIAGNGRLAGIQSAYKSYGSSFNTNRYKQELIDDADAHGVDPERIKAMKNPVLVRVMQPKDITADIGDRSNISTSMRLNALEQSKTDVQRMKNVMDTFENCAGSGVPKLSSVKEFLSHLPMNEQAALSTDDGQPSKQAQDRLTCAMLMHGYGDDFIVKKAGQALADGGKRYLNALTAAAPIFAKLKGTGEYDIRPMLTPVLHQVLSFENGLGQGHNAYQPGLFEDKQSAEVMSKFVDLLRDNETSGKRLTGIFTGLANKMHTLYKNDTALEQMLGEGGLLGKIDEKGKSGPIDRHKMLMHVIDELRAEFPPTESKRQAKLENQQRWNDAFSAAGLNPSMAAGNTGRPASANSTPSSTAQSATSAASGQPTRPTQPALTLADLLPSQRADPADYSRQGSLFGDSAEHLRSVHGRYREFLLNNLQEMIDNALRRDTAAQQRLFNRFDRLATEI